MDELCSVDFAFTVDRMKQHPISMDGLWDCTDAILFLERIAQRSPSGIITVNPLDPLHSSCIAELGSNE
jgi:hypothetical protein